MARHARALVYQGPEDEARDEGSRASIHEHVAEVDKLTDKLVARVDTAISRQAVRARVCREFNALGHSRIRQFVPVFVQRRVRAGLRG